MKYLSLLAFSLLMFFTSQAQWPPSMTIYGSTQYRIDIDSTIFLPTGCGFPTSLKAVTRNKAAYYFDSCAGKSYIYNPKTLAWSAIADSSLIPAAGYGLTGNLRVDTSTLKGSFGDFYTNNNWNLLNTFDTIGVNTQLPATPSWKFFPWIYGGYRLALGLQNGTSLRKQFWYGSGGTFGINGKYDGSDASAHSSGVAIADRENVDNRFYWGLYSYNKEFTIGYWNDSTIAQASLNKRPVIKIDSIGNVTFLQSTATARNYGLFKYWGNLHSAFDDSTLIDKSFGDSAYVKISGTQTINGDKTFTSSITQPYPTYSSSAASISAGAGAGTGATVTSISGNGVYGSFVLNCGSGITTSTNQTILTFSFSPALSSVPQAIIITRNNQGGGTLGVLYFDRDGSTTSSCVIKNAGNISAASSVSNFGLSYQILY